MKHPTNAQVRKALQGSIKKWNKIAAGKLEDEGIHNCPLCKIFHSRHVPWGAKCRGCPVEVNTGRPGCYGTPYDEWIGAGGRSTGLANTLYLQMVALKEVAYLESLDRKFFVDGV